MEFEITDRVVEDQVYIITFSGLPAIPPNPKYITYYDVVRSSDRKVIKSFTDLYEAAYYKKELEKLLGPHSYT